MRNRLFLVSFDRIFIRGGIFLIKFFVLIALFALFCPPGRLYAGELKDIAFEDFKTLKADYKKFYLGKDTYIRLGAGLAVAGIAANSSMDREANEYYQDNLRNGLTDSVSDMSRLAGEFWITIPVLAGVRVLGSPEASSWAGMSLRALFLGAPAGIAMQYATGGSRPKEGGSGWKPFRDNNGLSGHSFIGAVPFISAAKLTDKKGMKTLLYAASMLPALSRINDREHYLSQAALGWYLAYLCTESAGEGVGNGNDGGLSFSAMPFKDGAILFVSRRF